MMADHPENQAERIAYRINDNMNGDERTLKISQMMPDTKIEGPNERTVLGGLEKIAIERAGQGIQAQTENLMRVTETGFPGEEEAQTGQKMRVTKRPAPGKEHLKMTGAVLADVNEGTARTPTRKEAGGMADSHGEETVQKGKEETVKTKREMNKIKLGTKLGGKIVLVEKRSDMNRTKMNKPRENRPEEEITLKKRTGEKETTTGMVWRTARNARKETKGVPHIAKKEKERSGKNIGGETDRNFRNIDTKMAETDKRGTTKMNRKKTRNTEGGINMMKVKR